MVLGAAVPSSGKPSRSENAGLARSPKASTPANTPEAVNRWTDQAFNRGLSKVAKPSLWARLRPFQFVDQIVGLGANGIDIVPLILLVETAFTQQIESVFDRLEIDLQRFAP